MLRNWIKLSFVGALFVLQLAAVKVQDVDPVQLPLNKAYSPVEVDTALKVGAKDREWILTKKGDGLYEAELFVRKHYLKVNITVDSEAVKLTYLDSKNLDYDGVSIHSKYQNWTRNLLQSTEKALAAKTPAEVKPEASVDPFQRSLALNGLYKPEAIEMALRKGAAAQNWVLHDQGNGRFTAELKVRDHYLKVLIVESPEQLQVSYSDSKNLDYSGTSIHSKYYTWVQNLLTAVKERLDHK